MKKTTLLVVGTMIGMGILNMAQPVSAALVDGDNTANVEINGLIGKQDNTDPDVNLPEGSDEWINVTVDTATAFHTTSASKHRKIESADYQIENNSGRAVNVSVANVTGTPNLVNTLNLNAKMQGNALVNPGAITLVDNNELVPMNGQTQWLKLANVEGKFNLANDTAAQFSNKAQFSFGGSTTEEASLLTNVAAENYTMTLKFESIQADGVTVGR